MIVCHCEVVSDREVSAAITSGAGSVAAVCWMTGAGGGRACGGCLASIKQLLGRPAPGSAAPGSVAPGSAASASAAGSPASACPRLGPVADSVPDVSVEVARAAG